MGCAVWTVDFFAFLSDIESFTARLPLGASIAISRQHFFLFLLVIMIFSWKSSACFCEPAFYRLTHVLYAMEVHT